MGVLSLNIHYTDTHSVMGMASLCLEEIIKNPERTQPQAFLEVTFEWEGGAVPLHC